MGKWLSQFLAEYQDSRTDILDTMDSVSSVAVPETQESGQNFPGAVPPVHPLPAHCFVTWCNSDGQLCGGWDQREASTVKQCHGIGAICQVELSNGAMIPLRAVQAVGQLNAEGRLIAAWRVREHGYDGRGTS